MASQPTESHPNIRSFAKKISKERLNFTSETIGPAESYYVGWLDLMGAGHAMSTSVQKAANFLVRLHMAVETARIASGFDVTMLPINDGIFILSNKKAELITILQHSMALLAARFIATLRPKDRCLMKGGIAYGPVYRGQALADGIGIKKLRENASFLDRVLFGPAIIQAYESERQAPPYGFAIHESARSFAASGDAPFQMTHWLWWQSHSEIRTIKGFPSLPELKECLWTDLSKHFDWMSDTLLFHGLPPDKVSQWRTVSKQYFTAD